MPVLIIIILMNMAVFGLHYKMVLAKEDFPRYEHSAGVQQDLPVGYFVKAYDRSALYSLVPLFTSVFAALVTRKIGLELYLSAFVSIFLGLFSALNHTLFRSAMGLRIIPHQPR